MRGHWWRVDRFWHQRTLSQQADSPSPQDRRTRPEASVTTTFRPPWINVGRNVGPQDHLQRLSSSKILSGKGSFPSSPKPAWARSKEAQENGNEPLCDHAAQQTLAGECCNRSHNYVPERQSRRRERIIFLLVQRSSLRLGMPGIQ